MYLNKQEAKMYRVRKIEEDKTEENNQREKERQNIVEK